jgi:DNA polymerase III alpha subunit|tara:strand:+ start:218 stop:796 length:579 start_codon:yes stop_codon:yes gene_type:complete
MIVNTDIDIDIANRDKLLALIKNTPAMIKREHIEKKHNTGVYFHEIPTNPYNGLATIDHKEAEKMGYFKMDLLNVSAYNDISNKAELDELIDMEPMWDLLEHSEIVEKCFHIHSHFSIVQQMKPSSVGQLAAVLAMIRPAKSYLIGKDWDTVMNNIWVKPEDDSYYFKKSHAHSYAMVVVMQLNKIVKDSFS